MVGLVQDKLLSKGDNIVNYEEDARFRYVSEILLDPYGALMHIRELRKERDTFERRLNRLDKRLNELEADIPPGLEHMKGWDV